MIHAFCRLFLVNLFYRYWKTDLHYWIKRVAFTVPSLCHDVKVSFLAIRMLISQACRCSQKRSLVNLGVVVFRLVLVVVAIGMIVLSGSRYSCAPGDAVNDADHCTNYDTGREAQHGSAVDVGHGHLHGPRSEVGG